MTDAEARYARAAAPLWREKIAHLAEAHHVPPQTVALACLRAGIAALYELGNGDMGLVRDDCADLIEDVLRHPTTAPAAERTT